MKQLLLILSLALICATIPFFYQDSSSESALEIGPRERYMRMLLADPSTGEIPQNARAHELAFAKRFKEKTTSDAFAKVQANDQWSFAGPNALGGRTRAIAQDITNEQKTAIVKEITKRFNSTVKENRFETVGPAIGSEVAQRAGYDISECEANPLYGKVKTVKDFVMFFTHQPRIKQAEQAAPSNGEKPSN